MRRARCGSDLRGEEAWLQEASVECEKRNLLRHHDGLLRRHLPDLGIGRRACVHRSPSSRSPRIVVSEISRNGADLTIRMISDDLTRIPSGMHGEAGEA